MIKTTKQMENQMKPLTVEDFEYFHDREYNELDLRNELDEDDDEYLTYDEVHDGALDNTIEYCIHLGYSREEVESVCEQWMDQPY